MENKNEKGGSYSYIYAYRSFIGLMKFATMLLTVRIVSSKKNSQASLNWTVMFVVIEKAPLNVSLLWAGASGPFLANEKLIFILSLSLFLEHRLNHVAPTVCIHGQFHRGKTNVSGLETSRFSPLLTTQDVVLSNDQMSLLWSSLHLYRQIQETICMRYTKANLFNVFCLY